MALDITTSAEYRKLRAELKTLWQAANTPCWICGQATIDYDGPPNERESFELDHRISRKRRPDLAMDRNNMAPSHGRCNRGKGAGNAIAPVGETTEDW